MTRLIIRMMSSKRIHIMQVGSHVAVHSGFEIACQQKTNMEVELSVGNRVISLNVNFSN